MKALRIAAQILIGSVFALMAIGIVGLFLLAFWQFLLVFFGLILGTVVIGGVLWIGFGSIAYAVQELTRWTKERRK
ncbi:membrane protein [Streptomyces phage LuckySocke]|jgi:hypothetical protein|nr:membrane protein [Streptomyces phage Alone3]WPH58867.1 membrane protein [Streptomyces phage LuckySocke]